MPSPVLGILTLYLNDKKQLEEKKIYERMISEGERLGLDVYVFTPSDVHPSKEMIHALIYETEHKRWARKWRKFPDMIFDRCRIQRSARFQELKHFRVKYAHLLFLNRPLRNKWTIHQVLHKKQRFKPYLLDTKLFSSNTDLKSMLKKHSLLYVKPINGTGGRGILRIERLTRGGLLLVQGRDHNRQILEPRQMHYSLLPKLLKNWGVKSRYIIQEGVQLQLSNGRVHDYRMLVQKNQDGIWEFTGCAGRIGGYKSVTSNLHGGGTAIEMNELLSQWLTDSDKRAEVRSAVEQFGVDVAKYLEATYGALCELALDIAIDKNGDIYLIEVNPKPAREVFAQIGQNEVYKQAIVKPLEYSLWLYNQRSLSYN
ncbi:YheC/YheD family protein [Paenibacillus provencensis]|uniref:YheC/YheD family protein n=1 Tax=Paenibacillus provencensis TaxID=441151 RepID=A0ABW3Q3X2_9BACL|nr:YheC/YheD family protein [Paenibacillus sp. MER 78]MCM3127318.1 YheC/YheD family protein [Paenibacillus sp. MER 78]